MERKLADVLVQADAHLEYQGMGAAPPPNRSVEENERRQLEHEDSNGKDESANLKIGCHRNWR